MKDLLPPEVYNRTDKIGFAIPNRSFNSGKIKEYFYNLINNTKNESIQLINKQLFLDEYFSKSAENILDWKFWKVVSVILWFKLFNTSKV